MGKGDSATVLRGPIAAAPWASTVPDWVLWMDDSTGGSSRLYRPSKPGETLPLHSYIPSGTSDGSGWVPVGGRQSGFVHINASDSPYTVGTYDASTLFVDASAGSVVINLPAATTPGTIFSIKKTDTSPNTVTINPPSGGHTIDGLSSLIISIPNETVEILCYSYFDYYLLSVYSPHARSYKFKKYKRTSGNYVLNYPDTTAWREVDSTNLRLSVYAIVGDELRVNLNGMWYNENLMGYLDVATIVSGSPVNYFGSTGGTTDNGIPGWSTLNLAAYHAPTGGPTKTVVSGDISNGQVTVSLMARLGTSGTNKTLFGGSSIPLIFSLENLGQ